MKDKNAFWEQKLVKIYDQVKKMAGIVNQPASNKDECAGERMANSDPSAPALECPVEGNSQNIVDEKGWGTAGA